MSTGRNPGTPRGPENQRGNLQGACDPDSPRIEVGPSRPRTRSQGRLDPSSEGAATSSRNQRQSSRGEPSRGEQSSRDLPTGDIGGRVLRSHATASGHRSGALEVNPEVCLADQPRGRSLRRRATSPDSAVDSTAMENVPDTRSTPATPHRGRSASRSSRGASGSSRGASGSSRGASGSSRGASGSSGVQTQARANPSTSGNVFLKRTLPATSSSPFRRPVRMRASSPSPPRTPYPPCSQHNESSDSSSSSLLSLDSSSDSSAPSSPSK
ncbi:EZH inhibitory protein [Peromyscus maniculatus bairdii]|uniref:EZH inhibitory protein n=1 Tax=Peromyscus maniculatus bairdii TaxID=230844 RepID=UPI001C2E63AE|nr:EZH inhibitory protein [Peromyscus maniculatus bairdii]